jgi:hypothetical protein
MTKLVINRTWNGLGDLLALSTLPEIYTRIGYEVYMSDKQEFKNEGAKSLIMHNPYIKGVADEDSNLTHCHLFNRPYPYECENINYVARIEYMTFGKCYNNYPKLYYNPVFRKEWKDITFVDLNHFSATHTTPFIHPVDRYKEYIFHNNGNIVVQGDNYQTTSIWEYIDIIFSCKKFICTFSGSSVVASAINMRNTECIATHGYWEDRFNNLGKVFIFDNISYIGI